MTNDEDLLAAASVGMNGVWNAKEAVEQSMTATSTADKVDKLTLAVRLLIAHISHLESEAQRRDMNQQMGNY